MKIEYLNQDFYDEDVKDINALLSELSNNATLIDKEIIKNTLQNGFIAIIRGEEKIIGMATLIVHPTLLHGKQGRIEDVVVLSGYRGKGLGRQLVVRLIEQAKNLGLKKIDLTSGVNRTEAHKLYENLGFVKRDTNVYRLFL